MDKDTAKIVHIISHQTLLDQYDKQLWESIHKRFLEFPIFESTLEFKSPEDKLVYKAMISELERLAPTVFSEYSVNLE